MRACFITNRNDVFWSTNKASTPIRRSGGVAAPAMVFLPTVRFGCPMPTRLTTSAWGRESLMIRVDSGVCLLSRVLSAAQKHGGRAAKFRLACGRDRSPRARDGQGRLR